MAYNSNTIDMEKTTYLIFGGAIVLMLLVCYIIALVKAKKEEMVFTANGWDMACLLISPVLFTICALIGFEKELNSVQIVLLVISGLCMIGTIIFSIVCNAPNGWHIFISICAKLFTFWLTMVVVMIILTLIFVKLIFSLLSSHDDENEYIVLKYNKALQAYVGYHYTT